MRRGEERRVEKRIVEEFQDSIRFLFDYRGGVILIIQHT